MQLMGCKRGRPRLTASSNSYITRVLYLFNTLADSRGDRGSLPLAASITRVIISPVVGLGCALLPPFSLIRSHCNRAKWAVLTAVGVNTIHFSQSVEPGGYTEGGKKKNDSYRLVQTGERIRIEGSWKRSDRDA